MLQRGASRPRGPRHRSRPPGAARRSRAGRSAARRVAADLFDGERDRGMRRRAEHEELRGRGEQDRPQPPLARRQRSVEVSAEDGRSSPAGAARSRRRGARARGRGPRAAVPLSWRRPSRPRGCAVLQHRGEDATANSARGEPGLRGGCRRRFRGAVPGHGPGGARPRRLAALRRAHLGSAPGPAGTGARAAAPGPASPVIVAGAPPISWASASSSAMRFSVFGWVENQLSTPRPVSGLMMNMCAVAGTASASSLGMRCAYPGSCAGPRQATAAARRSSPRGGRPGTRASG